MFIDTHAHLDMKEFENDLQDVLDRAVRANVRRVVTVGVDRSSSETAIEIARQYPEVFAAAGIHPHNAGTCSKEELDSVAGLASQPGVVAWGEIGLDFFRCYAAAETQIYLFKSQLKLARDLKLPVIIHDRDAHGEVLEAVQALGPGERAGVIHCFSGDATLAETFIGLGYYISIPGTVTYKNASLVKQVASQIPLNRLLIETDAPFLAPVPKRGKRNEPALVCLTAREIAHLRGMNPEELGRITSRNALDLFQLDEVS